MSNRRLSDMSITVEHKNLEWRVIHGLTATKADAVVIKTSHQSALSTISSRKCWTIGHTALLMSRLTLKRKSIEASKSDQSAYKYK